MTDVERLPDWYNPFDFPDDIPLGPELDAKLEEIRNRPPIVVHEATFERSDIRKRLSAYVMTIGPAMAILRQEEYDDPRTRLLFESRIRMDQLARGIRERAVKLIRGIDLKYAHLGTLRINIPRCCWAPWFDPRRDPPSCCRFTGDDEQKAYAVIKDEGHRKWAVVLDPDSRSSDISPEWGRRLRDQLRLNREHQRNPKWNRKE